MIEQELLSPSIQYIINGLKVEANRSPWALVRLLEQAGVTEKELQPWADFAHPAEDSYGRKLVYADHGFDGVPYRFSGLPNTLLFELKITSWKQRLAGR